MKFKKIFSVIVLFAILTNLCSCSVSSGVSGLEKEILAGHSWGETKNEFNSKPKAQTLFGCEVDNLQFSCSANLGLYRIEYHLDSADYERIAKKVKSYCSAYEEKSNDSYIKYIEGYKDSTKIFIALDKDKDNESGYDIFIRMENDKYKDGF